MSEVLNQNFIDGTWQDAASGASFKDINPALNSDVIGQFPESGVEDVDDAVRAARTAFKTWDPCQLQPEVTYFGALAIS